MSTDFENAFHKEPVTFLLSNALRHLTQDQQRQLCNALLERLPVPASIEDEAERLYPYPDKSEHEEYEFEHLKECQQSRRSAHITCARQYMGEIEKLRAENAGLRKSLETFNGLQKSITELNNSNDPK